MRIIDDLYSRIYFQGAKEPVFEMLRIIFNDYGRPLASIEEMQTQKDFPFVNSRSIRADLWATDADGKVINIEIQRCKEPDVANRAAYHASALHVSNLAPNTAFSELPDVFIIFIMEKDPFGYGLPLYVFEAAERTLKFNGGFPVHYLFLNCQYVGDSPIGHLIHDIMCPEVKDMKNEILAQRARELKETPACQKTYSELLEEFRLVAQDEVRAEAEAKVEQAEAKIKQVRADAKAKAEQAEAKVAKAEQDVEMTVLKLHKMGTFSLAQISELVNRPIERVRAVLGRQASC